MAVQTVPSRTGISANEFYNSFASFPASGRDSVIYIDKALGQAYIWDGSAYDLISGGSGGGGGTWDSLTGTLTTTQSFWSQMPKFPLSLNYIIEEYDQFPGNIASFVGMMYGPASGASAAVQVRDVSEAMAGVNSTEKAMGVTSLNPGTSSTGRAALGFGGAQGAASFRFGITELIYGVRQNIYILGTVSENFQVWTGFMDIITAAPTRGCFFRYNYAVNGGRWEYCTVDGGATTATDTGVAPSAGVYQVMEIKSNTAGTSVAFYIDGVLVGTITSGIPTGAFGLLAISNCLRSAGSGVSGAGTVPIDATYMAIERLSVR